ncbi:MAG: (2Fe-2S)-binding protein [Thermoplasmata archaeon]|nr:MAG: (2Fe-2S)-binding protein [Thermoplasmata archaeon]
MGESEMVKITIDGQETEVEDGTTIMKAADKLDIEIPSLCYHPRIGALGNCRLCVSEITKENKSKVVSSCNYPIRKKDEGLSVSTKSDTIIKTRKNVLEMMLSRWPNVPVIKYLAEEYGVQKPRYSHPLADESENACVLCGRCVNACKNIMQQNIIDFSYQGYRRQVVMPFDEMNPDCLGCGTCTYVCPTGAISLTDDPNNPADSELLKEVGLSHSLEIHTLDPKQNEMSTVGTTHLVPIMNEFDLLPVQNFRFGNHPGADNIGSKAYRKRFDSGFDGCWAGCPVACSHVVANFQPRTGPFSGQKVYVDGPEYETIAGCGSNLGIFNPDTITEINFYCDTYGIDTISFGTAMAFAMECYEMGQIDNKATGGLELRFGNEDAALEILHQMAKGEGFGKIVGQGIRNMKKLFVEKYDADPNILNDIGMEAKGLEYSEYVTKESLAQQGGYGLALKGPQHDEAWLIFLDMVHNLMPTFEQKAEALHWFPMFRTWFGLCGLCKLPWNDIVPEDNKTTPEPAKVMKHVEWYSKYFTAVTGRKTAPEDIITLSERVYNFQRLFNLRMGFGKREHDNVPYRSVGPVTVEEYESRQDRYDKELKEKVGIDPSGMSTKEKRDALRKYREAEYEKLKDAVYKRRGWNVQGMPTLEKIKELGIDFQEVLELLKKQ